MFAGLRGTQNIIRFVDSIDEKSKPGSLFHAHDLFQLNRRFRWNVKYRRFKQQIDCSKLHTNTNLKMSRKYLKFFITAWSKTDKN